MRKNNTASASAASYVDIMEKNHMEIPWHDYADADSHVIISQAGLIEKSSVIGRVGLIMLSCGTGAWRVRTSMNRLSRELGVTCTVDVGLMSISFNCFDGKDCVSQSLSIANTGVNTSNLYRMEQFVDSFPTMEAKLTGEEIHKRLLSGGSVPVGETETEMVPEGVLHVALGDAEVPLGLPGFAAAGALVQGHIVGRRELRVELGL